MMYKSVDFTKGLSSHEAHERFVKHGPNEFEKKREFSAWKLALSQFKSPLIYVLFAAGLATIYLEELTDTVIIFLVVLMNTTLGFWQEFKAARSLEALRGYLRPVVSVIRDGKQVKVELSKIVPGDVCLLNAGESVPADGVLIEQTDLVITEAILTGESRPVNKEVMGGFNEPAKLSRLAQPAMASLSETQAGDKRDQESVSRLSSDGMAVPSAQSGEAKNFVYMGTTVAGGIGKMLVLRTGNLTEMGKIAKSIATAEEEDTPLQKKLAGLAKMLMYVVVTATIAIFVVGVLRGEKLIEMFETAVAIAVAAIPEGLAVGMTVILALGMQRILKKKALVRKLVAAETLGSVSVICCDKTGTLTEGKMRVVDFKGNRDGLMKAAMLANDERDEEGLAMMDWVRGELKKDEVGWGKGKDLEKLKKQFGRVDEIPFTSEKKFMVSKVSEGGGYSVQMAGAPEVVLARCNIGKKDEREQVELVRKMAQEGNRLIGFASREAGSKKELEDGEIRDMKWLGVLAFDDPVRANVKEALADAMAAGVGVKVITGDYKETAMAVMRKLWPDSRGVSESEVMTGDELVKLSGEELKKRIEKTVLFARTTPDQKLKIVEALKSSGGVVAMTGDGVNDAPALKAADIGLVVNEATDVSKQTADLVLLDSNFRTIVEAIREGRVIYETMRKVVTFLLTDAFQELVLVGGSLILGLPLPLTAAQILWINLVEDGLLGVALAFDLTDEGVMKEKPRKREGSIIDGEIRVLMLLIGLVVNLVILGIYFTLLRRGLPIEQLQTMMFVAVGVNSPLYVFSIKNLRVNIWRQNLLDNKFLLLAVGVGVALMIAAFEVPILRTLLGTVNLNMEETGLLVGLAVLTVGLIEAVKWGYIKRYQRYQKH